jgi:ElaB/YqjD/DUF883 family membrane-anchored ribosome-binding protein
MAEDEVIIHQMEETRASLADKLETLEETVMGTVDTVKDTVQEAKCAVTDTVASVKESIQDTVEHVKDSVQQTFDVRHQVRQRPWTMVGGSVAVGFLLGRLLGGTPEARYARRAARHVSHTVQHAVDARRNGGIREEYAAMAPVRTESGYYPSPKEEPGLLSELGTKFAPEIAQLRGLAIGTALSLVRDFIVQSAPESVGSQINEVANNITTKLGGEPIQGPVTEHWARDRVASSFAQAPRSGTANCVGASDTYHD